MTSCKLIPEKSKDKFKTEFNVKFDLTGFSDEDLTQFCKWLREGTSSIWTCTQDLANIIENK